MQVVALSFALALPLKPRQVLTRLYGGAGGIRTLDLLHAMQALSLLSHSPKLVSILVPKPAFVKRGLVLGGKIVAEGLPVAGA
jgi:hypothetical protein